jgi:hypothetical protein
MRRCYGVCVVHDCHSVVWAVMVPLICDLQRLYPELRLPALLLPLGRPTLSNLVE